MTGKMYVTGRNGKEDETSVVIISAVLSFFFVSFLGTVGLKYYEYEKCVLHTD